MFDFPPLPQPPPPHGVYIYVDALDYKLLYHHVTHIKIKMVKGLTNVYIGIIICYITKLHIAIS